MSRTLQGGRLGRLAVAVAACGLGCGASDTPPRGPVALSAPSASGYAPIWVNDDLRPIGELVAVGATMVGIVIDHDLLHLVGLDPATGRELWRQLTTPGAVAVNQVISVVPIGDDKLAYLRTYPYNRARTLLVVADARTGRDLAASPRAMFAGSLPYLCENGRDACIIAYESGDHERQEYRLDVTTRDYRATGEPMPSGTRLFYPPNLVDLGDRPGRTLGWLHDGALQWRTPIGAAFPPGFSTEYGWSWRWFADQHIVVGSLHGAPVISGEIVTRDLTGGAATAALDETTGEVLWRDRGSDLQCNLGDRDYGPDHEHAVRCRSHGQVTMRIGSPISYQVQDVTIEGFEPTTGQTTWSVALAPTETVISSDAILPIAGPAQVVLRGADGAVVLDYATGEVTKPRPGATFWCTARMRYAIDLPFVVRGRTLGYERPGGRLAAMCDARGRLSTVPPSPEATIAIGARVGDYAAVAWSGGYVGFRLR